MQTVSDITHEWLHHNQIISYTLKSARMSSIAKWSDLSLEVLRDWPKDRPYLALHDISQSGIGVLYLAAVNYDVFNIGVVPKAREQVESIVKAHSSWNLALAVVVSPSLSGQMAKLQFAPQYSGSVDIQAKAFFYHSAALKWLQSFV